MTPTDPQRTETERHPSLRFERERGVTEIMVNRGLTHVTVRFAHDNLAAERLNLLQTLASSRISIFLVKLHPQGVSFAVREDAVDACLRLLQERGVDHSVLKNLGLVAPVAGAMRDLSGVMARIYEALVESGVRVRQTGDAHNTVVLLVEGEQVDRAREALEATFQIGAYAPEAITASDPDRRAS